MRHSSLVNRTGTILCLSILIPAFAASAPAQVPTVQEKTRDLERRDGFFPFYWNEKDGTLLLEVPGNRINQEDRYRLQCTVYRLPKPPCVRPEFR